MNGRLELQQKDLIKCEQLLTSLPPYCTDWYTSLRVSGASPKTCLNYIYKVADFLSTTTDFTRANVNSYLLSKQTISNGTQSSKATQQLHWSSLNSFFTYLVEENIIEKNPICAGSRPKGDDLERINMHRVLLTKEDFNAILNTVKAGCGTDHQRNYLCKTQNRDMAIMYLFMCTGLRESALISLDKGNINFESKTLFVYDKGEIPHQFTLNDNCINAIQLMLATRTDEMEALFVTTRKGETQRMSVQNVIAIIKKFTSAALDKPLSPHKLRAGVCSILYNETKDIEFVRRFIGHSNANVTKRYIVTNGEEMKRGSEILAF